MPPAIVFGALLAAGVSVGVGAIVAGSIASITLAGFATAFATSLAVGAISKALVKSPQAGSGGSGAVQSQGRLVTIRQPIAARQVIVGSALVGGVITFIEQTNDDNVLHLIVTLSGHRCNAMLGIYANGVLLGAPDPVTGIFSGSGQYLNRLAMYVSLGDEGDAQPFPNLVARSAKWTNAHLQAGCTKVYITLFADRDAFPNGVPNFTFLMEGALIYDPRTLTTDYSNNGALWVSHYLSDAADYGLQADYDEEIDETGLIAAANISDEDIDLAAGGTEKRYPVNGAFLTSEKPGDVIGRLLAAMAGRAVNAGQYWHIHAGAFESPSLTLGLSDYAGSSTTQSLVSRRDNCNGVKGVFVDPASSWQPTDFPAVASDTYLEQDGGERVWRDIDLTAFVTSGTQAQRLAKIELLRTRQGETHTATFKLKAWRAMTGKTVALDDAQLGWSGKAFEVYGSKFIVANDANGAPVLNVELSLRESAAAVYDWTTDDESPVDPAPNTNLPDPLTVAAPGTPAVIESKYDTNEAAGVKAMAAMSWAGSTSAFIEFYQPEYKLHSATEWTVFPTQTGLTRNILDTAAGIYDFRVKAINTLGVHSAYSATLTQEIYGLSDTPSALTGLSIQKLGSSAFITFTQSVDMDVRRGGRILVRHSESTSSPPWEQSLSIGNIDGYPGDAVYVLVPLKAGTYLLKARDSTGQESAAALVVSDGATALTFSPLANVIEDTSFPGSHSNTVAVDGVLKLAGSGLFDDIPDFDAISDLDSYGGIVSSGTYTFSAGIDLGSVKAVQLYSTIEAATDNVNDLIDDREGMIDDWLDFDGAAAGGSTDAWLEARSTPDNPAGSPTWSAWQRLDRSEYHARAFQFRAQLSTTDSAYNILLSKLRAYAQEVI